MQRCVRRASLGPAVCNRRGKPNKIRYKPCETSETILRESAAIVRKRMIAFEDDEALTETFNQSARQYFTMLSNNVLLMFRSWQEKLVHWELTRLGVKKTLITFLRKFIICKANRSKLGPDASKCRSVVLEGPDRAKQSDIQDIIKRVGTPLNQLSSNEEHWDGVLQTLNLPSKRNRNLPVFIAAGL